MDETTTTHRKKFWTRRRLAAAGVLVAMALAGAGSFVPDWGLRYGVVRALRDLGWPQVSVSRADLSLFNGAVVVRRVQAGETLGRMLGIDGLDLTFRWKPLFSRRVSVERLDLAGVDVDIRRQGDGWQVNGLPLAVSGGGDAVSTWTYDITTLTLTGSRLRLTDGATTMEVEVERLEVQDLDSREPDKPTRYRLTGRVNGAAFRLEGTATPFAAQPQWAMRLNLAGFDLGAVAEAARAAGAGQLSGRLDADLGVHGAVGAPLTVDGRVTLADGAWAKDTTRMTAARLALEVTGGRWDGTRLDAAGKVEAETWLLEDGGVTETAASARLHARTFQWDGAARRLNWDGTLGLHSHRVAVDDVRVDHATLEWNGSTRLNLAPKASSFVHAEGRAEIGQAQAAVGPWQVEARRLAAQGVFEHARPEGMLPPVAGRMEVSAEGLSVRGDGQDWVHADHAEARDLRLTPGTNATVARLELHGLGLLSRPGKGGYPWRLEARQTVLEKANAAADGTVTAARLTLSGAVARLTRNRDGFVGLPPSQADTAGEPAQPAPRLALNRLRVSGDSRIEFDDHTVPEPVRLRLDGVDVAVAELDTSRPDRDSPFIAKARIGAARLSAQGRARPFADVPGGEAKVEVRALELPPLSGYAADKLGVHVQTGQLDADIAMAAQQGRLDGTLSLTLSELFVAQPDPNAPLAKTADMPIETVLDLLRDSENRIRLSIPVRGDLSNPDFDISDAVGQAVGGALKSTVFTTLKVAFPLAGLISLALDDGDRRLALEPLGFAPGSDVLDEAERKRLVAVAGLMGQRPALRLTLCGVATQAADSPVLAERKRQEEMGLLAKLQKLVGSTPPPLGAQEGDRLADLADARAQAAKTYLVDEAGIDPGRLFTCRPRIDADAQAKPRVDLVL